MAKPRSNLKTASGRTLLTGDPIRSTADPVVKRMFRILGRHLNAGDRFQLHMYFDVENARWLKNVMRDGLLQLRKDD